MCSTRKAAHSSISFDVPMLRKNEDEVELNVRLDMLGNHNLPHTPAFDFAFAFLVHPHTHTPAFLFVPLWSLVPAAASCFTPAFALMPVSSVSYTVKDKSSVQKAREKHLV